MDSLKAIGLKASNLLDGMGGDIKLKSLEGKLGSEGKGQTIEQKEKAATDFEALLVGQMFKEMWKNTEGSNGDSMFASEQEPIYRDMLNEELAKEIADKQSIGIKEIILKSFK